MASATAAEPVNQPPSTLRRVVTASMAGTVVEWYEFYQYATAATLVFNVVMFPPSDDPYTPIIAALDFGLPQDQVLLWFAILFAVNLQTSFLTPPFGYALFYIRGIAPPEISTRMIYQGIVPFVIIQLVALVLTIMFPQLALWLPGVLLGP